MATEPYNTGAGPANWERPVSPNRNSASPHHLHQTTAKDLYTAAAIGYYFYTEAQGKDLSTASKQLKWAAGTTLKACVILISTVVGGLLIAAGFFTLVAWLFTLAGD